MKRLTVLLLIILTAIIFIESCAVNPVTGKKEIMLISKSAEINIGKNLDAGMKQEIGIYNSLNLNSYVRGIGNKLVPFTHRPNLKYYFSVLNTPVVNAFAAPGGYIYVTRGLLAIITNEAELAVILGHELGHVNARHSAKAMTKQILFTLGLVIGSELNEKIRKYAPLASIATQLLFLKYSRDNEYQADALGIEYSRKGGYDPGAMIGFFNTLNRSVKRSGSSHIPNFLSTHPLNDRRIRKVKNLLQDGDKNRLIKTNIFLNKINNIVYGNDPREGYRKNGFFYHPGMRFKFKIPNGWKFTNSPQKVTLASSNGKAAMILSAEKNTSDLEGYSKKVITKFSNPRIQSWNQGYINGLNALYKSVLLVSDDQNQGNAEETQADLTFIRKGNMIYTFIAISLKDDFFEYNRQFNKTIISFSHLKDSRFINVKPTRIRIKRVNRRESLRKFLMGKSVNRKWFKDIAHINGIKLDTILKRGKLIKVLSKY